MRSLRPLYRSRQVLHALRPALAPEDLEQVKTLLSAEQASLFFDMEKRDQRHAIEVARRLRATSVADDSDVLVAALLHDCGKGAVPVWLRILNVLSPAAVEHIAQEGAGPVRSAAHRLRHHAAIGARLARTAGCTPTTVRLIGGDVNSDESARLALLQAADDAS
jgi:HD-like signal output (HDOD) protein